MGKANAIPASLGHRHLSWCKVAAQEMTIAKGHQLQYFAGLGKQPLRGTTPIKDLHERRGSGLS